MSAKGSVKSEACISVTDEEGRAVRIYITFTALR